MLQDWANFEPIWVEDTRLAGVGVKFVRVLDVSKVRATSSALSCEVKLTSREPSGWVTALRLLALGVMSLVPRVYSRKALRPSASRSAVGLPVKVTASEVLGLPPMVVLGRQLVAASRSNGRIGEMEISE